MSMKDHLRKFFTSAAAHHTAMAQLAEAAMNGCDEDSDERTVHKTAMESHASHGQVCTECAKACEESSKADGGDTLEKLPAGFTTIHEAAPQRVRAIARIGQPELASSFVADPIFKNVFEDEQ